MTFSFLFRARVFVSHHHHHHPCGDSSHSLSIAGGPVVSKMTDNLRLRNEPVVVWFDRELDLPGGDVQDDDDDYNDEENIHTQARKYRPKRRIRLYYKYVAGSALIIVLALIVVVAFVSVRSSGASQNVATPGDGGSGTTSLPVTSPPPPEPAPPQTAAIPGGVLVTTQEQHNTDLQRTEYTAVMYYHQDNGSAEVKAHEWLKSWDEWARHVQALSIWKDKITVATMACSSEEDLRVAGSNFCTTTMGHRFWRIQPEIAWYWQHHLIAKQSTSSIPAHRTRLEFWDDYLTKLIQSDKSGHH